MGFDWEYLLDAEGENLQTRYDDICGGPEYSSSDDDCWDDDHADYDWDIGWDDDWEDEPSDPVPESLRGTCAAGEIVLASSALFRTHRLRLYHELAFNDQPMNYLVATEDTALLGILLTDDRKAGCSENEFCGIPLLRLPRERMEQGMPQEVISRLTEILASQHQQSTSFQSRIEPVPVELHARMAALHMIQQKDGHLWGPTSYGRSLGVMDGYLPSDEEERYCHTLFLFTPYKVQLDEALAFGQARGAPFRRTLSWAQTMLRASQGLPRSDGYAASIAQAFASMPLAEYMASSPKNLETLRGAFPLDGDATYSEAAWHVFRVCADSDGTEEYNLHCMSLIFALVQPMFAMLSAMQRPAT